MASYITAEELVTYGISVDALGSASGDVISAACAAASAMLDSSLRDKKQLPLTRVGLDVKLNVAKYAAFEILRMRGFSPEGIDESIRDGHAQAETWFRDIAKGVRVPDVDDSSSSGDAQVSDPVVLQPRSGPGGVISSGAPRSRGWV